jgi:hypothetical protein
MHLQTLAGWGLHLAHHTIKPPKTSSPPTNPCSPNPKLPSNNPLLIEGKREVGHNNGWKANKFDTNTCLLQGIVSLNPPLPSKKQSHHQERLPPHNKANPRVCVSATSPLSPQRGHADTPHWLKGTLNNPLAHLKGTHVCVCVCVCAPLLPALPTSHKFTTISSPQPPPHHGCYVTISPSLPYPTKGSLHPNECTLGGATQPCSLQGKHLYTTHNRGTPW